MSPSNYFYTTKRSVSNINQSQLSETTAALSALNKKMKESPNNASNIELQNISGILSRTN